MLKVIASCINAQLRRSNLVPSIRDVTVILMCATAWLMSSSPCIVCGFDSYTVLLK